MTYYKGQLYYVDQSIQYLIWYLAKEFDQVNYPRLKSKACISDLADNAKTVVITL